MMAARTRKVRHDDLTREKIQTSQLINRLMKHIDGEVELSSTQLRSIEILLKKSLPDLQSIEMVAEVNSTHEVVDVSKLNTEELSNLERTLAKATVTSGSESGDGEARPDKVH